ncbi:MAG: type II toxin-antitoxin system VapC family toxin [Candidatus Jordarchaeum sp.]|uniref:type II toxin-antitoxin system VapC family toxin n=1 Tax=Candidatus Jordarchaeum sp. TaxID=2823881 RepID=UPI004049B4FB
MNIALDTGVLVAAIKKRGEKYNQEAVRIADLIRDSKSNAVTSSLVLIEFPGALASSTTMPIEKIYAAELSVQKNFNLIILPFHPYVNTTLNLIFEFRELKRKLGIGAADFHHLATAIDEDAEAFVTVDERHLLKREAREALNKYIEILDPKEALEIFKE